MNYKSGHIYLVDKEPTNEELANFSKPVQFDICKNGLFYSILYDKNGNRYVEDRSKITTGFIKLGTIVRVGNVINIGVHPSGFNHWRINGVDVTSSNPATLELEPETNLYRIDSIVGNGAGGLFLFQGDADKNPIPLNPLNYPNYAFFKDVLITPNTGGSIDPEILNNYVSKEEENWKTITVSAGTNFSINITDKRTRFKIKSSNDIPKVLQSIVFSEETSRALEIWIYNDTNLNFSIPNSATNGLSKGFTTAQPPFIILPKTYEKLKYNPESNIIECWKVNAAAGLPAINTDNTLEGDGTSQNPLGLSVSKNAEINGKISKEGIELGNTGDVPNMRIGYLNGVYRAYGASNPIQDWAPFLQMSVGDSYAQISVDHYSGALSYRAGFQNNPYGATRTAWDNVNLVNPATQTWVTTQTTPATQAEVEASTGTASQPTSSEPETEDRKFLSLFNFFKLIKKLRYIHLLPNSATAVANRLRSDGSKLFYANNSAVEKEIAYVNDIATLLQQPIKTISANTTLDDSYHNAIVRVTTTCTITVPSTLRADFNAVFEAIGNISATFLEDTNTVFSAPFGKLLKDNSMCNLYKYNATTYRLNGGLLPV